VAGADALGTHERNDHRMWALTTASLVAGVLALFGSRLAYIVFVLTAVLYFPLEVGFAFAPQPCSLSLDGPLALYSLQNYPHIALFAVFFIVSRAQFRGRGWSGVAGAAFATLLMGAWVEIGEGLTGTGHCRLRDLVPDSAGVILGAGAVLLRQQALRFLPARIGRLALR